MPEIQLPTSDNGRATLLDQLYTTINAQPAAERPITDELFTQLKNARTAWQPLMTTVRQATQGQGKAVGNLAPARATAALFVSHYLQVFNLGVRRGRYQAADRALFGLPTASAELPDLGTEADLTTWLTNIASGEAALVAAGQPAMANPSAAEVAEAGAAFATQLAARGSSGTTKVQALGQLAPQRDTVDEVLADVYAELKHRHRKLTPPQNRALARTYGFRFTNHRGEQPEGRYAGSVAAAELLEVYEGHFGPTLTVVLRNPGLTAWEVGLAATDTSAAPLAVRVAAGTELRLPAADLGNLGHSYLLLRNLSPDQQGQWEVVFE